MIRPSSLLMTNDSRRAGGRPVIESKRYFNRRSSMGHRLGDAIQAIRAFPGASERSMATTPAKPLFRHHRSAMPNALSNPQRVPSSADVSRSTVASTLDATTIGDRPTL